MSKDELASFIESIMKTINKNGYPEKRVAISMDRLYESAHKKGLNFNKVRKELHKEGVQTELTSEKVIFSSLSEESTTDSSFADQMKDNLNGFNFDNLDKDQIMQQAADMMKNMSPDQLKAMQEAFTNMSEEQKAELIKKGKDLGII